MAKIKAFRAVRPTRDKVHLVVSRAVTTYKKSILTSKLAENPYTFIHIIHPEFFEKKGNITAPNSIERFKKIKNKYIEFYNKGIFQQEKEDSLYIYRQTKNDHQFIGVIAGTSVEEYQQNKIKKHEATLTSREEMFTNYLEKVGMNAEPVLLCHQKNKVIDDFLNEIVKTRPENEFTTTDKIKHEVWVIHGEKKDALINAYENIKNLYIADGHHRSASSVKLSERLKKKETTGNLKNHEFFLSYLINEEYLKILPFNRLCKSLNGHTADTFLKALATNFEVIPLQKAEEPNQLHEIHTFISGKWYKLKCKQHIIDKSDTVGTIDAEILTRYILKPLLNIVDLKTDKNIHFISGENSSLEIEKEVKKGIYKVGFSLYPVTIEQLKNVADENAIMPPKSTWIEPKLRSGLVIYMIGE